MTDIRGRALIAGDAEGRILRLGASISFWGGVEPASGRIIDPRHPEHGADISGRVLAVPATVGSSSSSAVMLELLRVGHAPAALLLGQVDAILTLGVVVAREMGYAVIPVLEVAPDVLAILPNGRAAQVSGDRIVLA